jgi:hypothetical protein
MPFGSAFGKITIQGKHYNIAPRQGAYKVTEAPSHMDVDPKLERRVIWRTFSGGIKDRREEASIDATLNSSPVFSFNKQNKVATGFYWGSGCDTRAGDRIFCQRAATASNFASALEVPLLIGDASVYSWVVGTHTIYALTTPPSTWSVYAIQYGGYLYVAVGDANSFYTWSQATSTTAWVQRSNQAGHFAVIRNQLWRSVAANIFSTVNTDPASQVWSSATVVGDPNTSITALDIWEDFLMIFKQDGIYNVDKTGQVYPLFPGFKNLGMNPRPLGQWRNSYYFASDVGLVWEVNKTEVKRIGFDRAEPYPMGGDSTALPAFSIPTAATRGVELPNCFVVGFNQFAGNTTSGAYFLAWDGVAWHPFHYFPDSAVDALGVTGGNISPTPQPVLQFAVQNRNTGINHIYTQSEPLIDPFLASDFDTSPQVIYMGADNGALEDEYKVLERINVWVDNHAAGTVRAAYALDEEIESLTFHDMGDPQGDLVQGSQQFNPPSPFPTYRKILVRFTLTAIASTDSPVIRYAVMHYKQRVPQRKVWTIQLLAEVNLVAAGGRIDVRHTPKILSDLNNARRNHQQVQFVDILGKVNQVYVDSVGEDIENLKGDLDPSFIVTTELVEAAVEQVVNNQ